MEGRADATTAAILPAEELSLMTGGLAGASVLVTGAAGFLGRHVLASLRARDARVVAVVRQESRWRDDGDGVPALEVDVCDGAAMTAAVTARAPSHVFHLAGVRPGTAVDAASYYRVNVGGTVNILEAVSRGAPEARVVVASSSAVYGNQETLPVRESAPVHPKSHYATSKVMLESVATAYGALEPVQITIARLFNLVGPGQPPELVLSDLARQVAEAERTESHLIRVGNLAPKRDFVDVRDAAEALCLLADSSSVGVFNVASGTSHSVQEGIDLLLARSTAHLDVESMGTRQRDADLLDESGAFVRLQDMTGWRPRIPFEESVSDLLDYWRTRVTARSQR